MDSHNHSGSWLFGDDPRFYPSSRSPVEQYRRCYTNQATDRWTHDCHSKFQPSYREGHPGWQSNFDQAQIEEQAEKTLTGKLLGLINSVINAVGTIRIDHDQMLVDHVRRIEALEQDRLCQANVIEEQAEKIEQLEIVVKHEHMWRNTMTDTSIIDLKNQWRQFEQFMAQANEEKSKSGKTELFTAQAQEIEALGGTVDKLRTRLTSYQRQQTDSHKANLRRIKQLDCEVLHLREKLAPVNSFLLHQSQKEEASRIQDYTEFSSDEDDVDINPIPTTRDAKVACTPSTEDIPSPLDEYHRVPDVQKEEPSSTQYELNEGQGSISKKPFTTTISTWEGDEISRDLFEDPLHMDTPLSMNEFTDEPSCDSCGLHCVPQLRACVNMIQVVPEIRKVKEKEVRDLKRTVKRKLHRQWVPRGVFDIKEQFNSNTINFEDKCAKSYMPRWKKRKQRDPIICDSCD